MDINKLSPTVSSSNTNTIFSDAFSADTFLKGFKIVFLFAAISCLAAFIISLSRLSGSKKDEKNCEFITPSPIQNNKRSKFLHNSLCSITNIKLHRIATCSDNS
jgi:hypothetical protein